MPGPKCQMCGTPLTYTGLCGPCAKATQKILDDLRKDEKGKGNG